MRLEIAGRPKDMRECPVCRAHMHSRRTARTDEQFDFLMQGLYGDVAAYERQEEALADAERATHAAEHAACAEAMREAQLAQKEAATAARHSNQHRQPHDHTCNSRQPHDHTCNSRPTNEHRNRDNSQSSGHATGHANGRANGHKRGSNVAQRGSGPQSGHINDRHLGTSRHCSCETQRSSRSSCSSNSSRSNTRPNMRGLDAAGLRGVASGSVKPGVRHDGASMQPVLPPRPGSKRGNSHAGSRTAVGRKFEQLSLAAAATATAKPIPAAAPHATRASKRGKLQ
uniref:Uncharacterized protein n=1 Tax=Chlamydomonas euryale TaxID=1486919 RepID=A0A7R9YYR5_9CHLO|mmetsp:Transcript_3494/g.9738  ORF Transcript_3494/g.9738 Transcript_3494/m.9738 type:complete len:285 (+) Transcript_3494:1-855(+)